MIQNYNVDYSVVGMAIDLILAIFMSSSYGKISKTNKAFQNLTVAMMISCLFDLISAVAISEAYRVSAPLNTLLSTLYFVTVLGVCYVFVRYIVTFVSNRRKGYDWLIYFAYVVIALGGVLLVVNLFTGLYFHFDADGSYVFGEGHALKYFVPTAVAMSMLGFICAYRHCFTKKQMFANLLYLALSAIGSILQGIIFTDVLLASSLPAISLLVVFFSLETPDYNRMIQANEKLKQANEDLKAAKDEADAANAAKSEFLMNMSHEVRTPINAILGYNEIMMKETKESQTASYAVNVQEASKTLLSIVNDILDYANMDRENVKIAADEYSVHSLVQDVLAYAEYHSSKKQLELITDIDETIPALLCGDAGRVMQIINNLVSNAVKYTKEGSVSISLKWNAKDNKSGELVFSVTDTGIGIKPEDVDKIRAGSFSRFDNKNTRDIQGIGLGLSVVTKLLAVMGSELQIESEYGKGSRFSFILEQSIVDAKGIGKIDRLAPLKELIQSTEEDLFIAPNARILAVDDNMMNLELFQGILKDTRMVIETAMNGKEAIEKIKQNHYDIIFLDHMMPVMDGLEAVRIIKSENLAENIPVIAFTANAVTGETEQYFEAGFDDYMSKPIMRKRLLEKIRSYLPKMVLSENQESADGEDKVIISEMDIQTDSKKQDTKDSVFGTASFLDRLSFLDTATGLSYCCESEDFYKEMIASYLEGNKLDSIAEAYNKEDWDNYRILVHALKSTSLTIGAVELSEHAKGLEFAAKDGKIEFIRANNSDVMKEYAHLMGQLNLAMDSKEQDIPVEQAEEEKQSRILVVDDDAINLRIAEKMLSGQYNVTCVSSGKEALDSLSKEIPNLVLLDLHMPDMDGFAVLGMMKADARFREIPTIFLTADSDRETEIKGFKEGALDFITKPFVADIMIQRVNRILELDRLQKQLQTEVEKQTSKAENRRKKVERLSLQVMKTLAATIDAKDKYTNGHSVRVADYSRAIAKRFGKNEKEQEDIYYMALLHDVGKIGIPDEIINKTSRLTDEEYAVIKTHPSIGADILKNISEIPNIGIGAHWHHERYDGRGYPDGLAGDDIPEIARMIGVADAYDAMTSKRSYRDVLGQEIVRGEIEKGRGSQFDPVFADIMLQLIDEDTAYTMHE